MPTLDFFPFPFLLGLLILTAACVRFRARGWRYLAVLALFGLYLMLVITVIFFPIPLPPDWPRNLTWSDTLRALSGVNLIPFRFGSLFSEWTSPYTILQEIAGNIFLTIPFGLGVCLLSRARMTTRRALAWALAAGLALEGTQLVMKLVIGYFIHAVDINDVILNGLGVLIGMGAYRAVHWITDRGHFVGSR